VSQSFDGPASDSPVFDPESSGLLDGLTGEVRAQRAELIVWLLGEGFTVAEIRSAFSPVLLPVRRVLGDDGSHVSARRISELSGLDLDEWIRFQRAAGLPRVDDPDAPLFMGADGAIASDIKAFLDLGIDADQLLTAVRVLAQGMANAAEVMRMAVLAATLRAGATELETAQASQALLDIAVPMLGPMVTDILLMQLRHTAVTEAINATEWAKGAPMPGARTIAASFADLVGFTKLGEEVPPERLEQLADRLAALAREVAVGPVRFVKTIGDAVMFVSTDAGNLLDAVLELVEAAERDGRLPNLRVGVAYGPAVSSAGDWFGSPVNKASRVTAVARPGAVLVTEAARTAIGDDARFVWSDAGARRLRGIKDEVRVFRARRAESALAQDGHSAGDGGGDQ
jgi:adenylate cyclase